MAQAKAESTKKAEPPTIRPSEHPITVSQGEVEQPELPKLHVFTKTNSDGDAIGWLWRFEFQGETVLQSDPDEPYGSRHAAIKHADAIGDRQFDNWQGGARVNVDAGPADD